MGRWRSRVAVGCLLALAVAEPVAAYQSTNDELIRGLELILLYAAIPITVLVEGILIYTVLKYRNNDDPKPTKENRRLEITWTIATAIVLVFVGIASYQVLANPFVTHQSDDLPGEDAVEIEVVASNYQWEFEYVDEGVRTTDRVVIPTDTEVYFNVTATEDSYIHGFHVPDLSLKQDANPGQHHVVKTEVYEEGEYRGYCAKYCGIGHSRMLFTVEAVSPEEYDEWVGDRGEGNESGG